MNSFEDWEIGLIRALNQPLPQVPRPFAEVAERAGVPEEQVIERVRGWLDSGVVRRFGARVNHRALGYRANGMAVWHVDDARVEEVGAHLAAQSEVSHCYARRAAPGWPYNLYAMIHGPSEDEVRAIAERMADTTGCRDYEVLFSSRELKKSAPMYFAEGGGEPAP